MSSSNDQPIPESPEAAPPAEPETSSALPDLEEISPPDALELSAESSQEDAGLQQRIDELEHQVADLEQELHQRKKPLVNTSNLSEKVHPLIFLLLALLLAAVPAVLVFRHRWLDIVDHKMPLSDYWQQNLFLSRTGLPPYFATIVICTLALLALVILWRNKPTLAIERPHPYSDSQAPIVAVEPEQRRAGRILLASASLVAIGSFIISLLAQQVTGWGFLLALVLYTLGWILIDSPLESLAKLKNWNWEAIIAAGLAHLALIAFIASCATQKGPLWLTILLLGLTWGNLLRFWRQIDPIYWIFNLAIVLYAIRINSWAFSVIGDDYAFFTTALRITETQDLTYVISHLFDVKGVYGAHPYFSSVLQALSMVFLGNNNFGWRFSNVYLNALSLVFFYAFFKTFVRKNIALVAVLLLAGSSYIMTFGKIGYNNMQSLFAMSLVLAAAAWVVRSRRILAFIGLGFSMGICLYVYPAALYILPVPILLLVFYDPPRDRQKLKGWLVMLVSLALLILPLIMQPHYWLEKVPGLFFNNPVIVESSNSLTEHFARNLIDALYSFLFIPNETHFVAVSYMDPLTGMFVLLGIASAIAYVRESRFLFFLLASFAVLVLLVGTSHDRPFPPTTRMFLMLPWFALFAAIGICWLAEYITSLDILRLSAKGLITLIVITIIAVNLFQAYPLSQRRSAAQQTMEVLFVRLLEELRSFEPLSIAPMTFLFISDENWGIDGFRLILQVYDYPASKVALERAVVSGAILPPTAQEILADRNTLVIIQPNLNTGWQEGLVPFLTANGKQPCEIKESTGSDTRFILWHSPDLAPLCSGMQ